MDCEVEEKPVEEVGELVTNSYNLNMLINFAHFSCIVRRYRNEN